MGLDLDPELLEMLDDGTVDRPAEIRVLVGDHAGLVANAIEDVL
jgi:hypothetical protein